MGRELLCCLVLAGFAVGACGGDGTGSPDGECSSCETGGEQATGDGDGDGEQDDPAGGTQGLGGDPGTGGTTSDSGGTLTAEGGMGGAVVASGGTQQLPESPRCDWVPACRSLIGSCFLQQLTCGNAEVFFYECGKGDELRKGYVFETDDAPDEYPCAGSGESIDCSAADEQWNVGCPD